MQTKIKTIFLLNLLCIYTNIYGSKHFIINLNASGKRTFNLAGDLLIKLPSNAILFSGQAQAKLDNTQVNAIDVNIESIGY